MIEQEKFRIDSALTTLESVKIKGAEDDYGKGYNKAIDFAMIVFKEYLFFEQIKEEMCDHYCKMPEFYLSQYKDPDEAHEIMVNECCTKCPLERLNK